MPKYKFIPLNSTVIYNCAWITPTFWGSPPRQLQPSQGTIGAPGTVFHPAPVEVANVPIDPASTYIANEMKNDMTWASENTQTVIKKTWISRCPRNLEENHLQNIELLEVPCEF